MTITVDAVFQNGRLQFNEPIQLTEGTPVRVVITPLDLKQAKTSANGREQVV